MALYIQKKLKNGATVGVWRIEESEEELQKSLDLPDEVLQEIALYRSEQSRREKLSVLALLKEMFGRTVQLGHHETGSPYIENDGTHVSITHTTMFSAVILHPTKDVGIDIESVRRDFSAVEKKALSEEEKDDLIKLDEDDAGDDEKVQERNTQLALYWCAKEALYKRMGRFAVNFAEDIEIEHFNVREDGELEASFKYGDRIPGEQEEENVEDFELSYEIFEDHALVWLVG